MDEHTLKIGILKSIEDLKSKIINEEELPHGPQDIHLLIEIDSLLDECLNNWYY